MKTKTKIKTVAGAHFIFVAAMALVWPSLGLACGIEGQATRTGGSKVDGTARVSTSWNRDTAYPRDGYYSLDLGNNACGERVEVYVNGYSIGEHSIPNKGNARVNFVLKGSSDTPVR